MAWKELFVSYGLKYRGAWAERSAVSRMERSVGSIIKAGERRFAFEYAALPTSWKPLAFATERGFIVSLSLAVKVNVATDLAC